MRKKKTAESKLTANTVVNAFKPEPDNSYAQFKKELQKAGYRDVFEQNNIAVRPCRH